MAWKIAFPVLLSGISIYLSLRFELSGPETVIIALQSLLIGFILDLVYDSYNATKERTVLKEAHLQLVRVSEVFRKWIAAASNPNPLFRKFLDEQAKYYDDFFSNAAEGVVRLHSKHNLLMYYGDFFRCAKPCSTIRATVLSVPNREWFEPIVAAHRDYISNRSGQVERIFILHIDDFKDSEKARRALEFMEMQKDVGVNVKFAIADALPDSLLKDIMILSDPYMGNVAYPLPTGEYLEADLITSEKEIEPLEGMWESLSRLYSSDFESRDQLLNQFKSYQENRLPR